jgi:hypothetical protein
MMKRQRGAHEYSDAIGSFVQGLLALSPAIWGIECWGEVDG